MSRVKEQMDKFMKGFCELIPHGLITIFDENELEVIYQFIVRKKAKIRNRYNQAPHLIEDTNGKVTTSQLDITNEIQEVSPFPAGDLKASTNRHA